MDKIDEVLEKTKKQKERYERAKGSRKDREDAKAIITLGVTLKWYHAFIPFCILKKMLKVKCISKEGETIKHTINGEAQQ